MTAVIVTVTGACGALARYLVGGLVQRRFDPDLPMGTAAVNLTGSLLLGFVVGIGLTGNALAGAAGALAGFTTYSTWMVEVVSLATEGGEGRVRSAIDLFGMMAAGLALALAGLALGRLLA